MSKMFITPRCTMLQMQLPSALTHLQEKHSLAELPLPPSRNENFLSRIAMASSEVKAPQLNAELIVSLNVEGLFVFGYKHDLPRAPKPLSRQSWA